MKKTGYIIRRCMRCNEIIYRFKKDERPSNLLLGAECWLHLLTCDREAYDEAIARLW